MDELKSCPFCGAKAKLDSDVIYWMVTCEECTANTGWFGSVEFAIAAWNRRTPTET